MKPEIRYHAIDYRKDKGGTATHYYGTKVVDGDKYYYTGKVDTPEGLGLSLINFLNEHPNAVFHNGFVHPTQKSSGKNTNPTKRPLSEAEQREFLKALRAA